MAANIRLRAALFSTAINPVPDGYLGGAERAQRGSVTCDARPRDAGRSANWFRHFVPREDQVFAFLGMEGTNFRRGPDTPSLYTGRLDHCRSDRESDMRGGLECGRQRQGRPYGVSINHASGPLVYRDVLLPVRRMHRSQAALFVRRLT